jgi:hypothetical protein
MINQDLNLAFAFKLLGRETIVSIFLFSEHYSLINKCRGIFLCQGLSEFF